MNRYLLDIFFIGGIAGLGVTSWELWQETGRLVAERDTLGGRVVSLEALLPCEPQFQIVCGIAPEGDTGLYQDGQEKRFRYAIEGADLGVVRCFTEDGKEVLP